VKRENVIFCKTREEKGPICVDKGINTFIDDTLQIIQLLENVSSISHTIWFAGDHSGDVSVNAHQLPSKCCPFSSWSSILAHLLELQSKVKN